jgi:hypothetical protein
MSELRIRTVANGKRAEGPTLKLWALNGNVYMSLEGPIGKDGFMVAHEDARALAAVLDAWTENGPEGA